MGNDEIFASSKSWTKGKVIVQISADKKILPNVGEVGGNCWTGGPCVVISWIGPNAAENLAEECVNSNTIPTPESSRFSPDEEERSHILRRFVFHDGLYYEEGFKHARPL